MNLGQFTLIETVFSFAICAMGAATLFLIQQRREVAQRFRAPIAMLSVVTVVSGYSYVRLLEGFNRAFIVTGSAVQGTGQPFDDTFRFGGWLIGFPMLLIAFVSLLDLPVRPARLRCLILGFLTAETVLLSCPAQMAVTPEARWIWWTVSFVPFMLIVVQLYGSLARSVLQQPAEVRSLIGLVRTLAILVWFVHPLRDILPFLDIVSADAFVIVQTGLALADLVGQGLCAVLLYMAAARKSQPTLLDDVAGSVPSRQNIHA